MTSNFKKISLVIEIKLEWNRVKISRFNKPFFVIYISR
ncbi:hypothetical protein SAMN05444380_10535 [Thermophagus xiamenensis]|uniref:Uncharacterized protein n=1 Tax=Thermophagus xiamenensis TaxID=385682 RepID=A0A1I1WZD0_9BACT|nr:hypothetical protein SAMN05444380_10535 [Thermophagus xiamenensis]